MGSSLGASAAQARWSLYRAIVATSKGRARRRVEVRVAMMTSLTRKPGSREPGLGRKFSAKQLCEQPEHRAGIHERPWLVQVIVNQRRRVDAEAVVDGRQQLDRVHGAIHGGRAVGVGLAVELAAGHA